MKRLNEFVSEKAGFYGNLWLIAPVVIWFSYWPNFHFGQDSTMNFEISLPIALLLVMGLTSIPSIVKNWRSLAKNHLVWLIATLVGYTCLTIIWSVNPLRSLLTAGIAGLIGLVAIGVIAEGEKLRRLLPKIVNIYLVSALVMSGLAIVQFVAGIWLPQSVTLLCDGCVAQQFGFSRPNVFAIEPQFFGNMLLAPILIVAHRILSGTAKVRLFDLGDSFALMLFAMLLTMSRGAIYALVVGLVVLVIVCHRQFRKVGLLIGLSFITLVASLGAQGLASVLNPTISETFMGAVSKSINQLTLGVVNITTKNKNEKETLKTSPEVIVESENQPQEIKLEPNYDGYVEESTTARTSRSGMALEVWQKNLQTMLFGVGIGGAGVAMHQGFPDQIGAREIVQNEFVERLLERGVIGLGLSLAVLGYVFYLTRHKKWLWAIIIALLLQLNFYSGYPNAVHVYLTLILMIICSRSGFDSANAKNLGKRD